MFKEEKLRMTSFVYMVQSGNFGHQVNRDTIQNFENSGNPDEMTATSRQNFHCLLSSFIFFIPIIKL